MCRYARTGIWLFLGIAVHIRYISERFEAVLNRSHWPAPVHAIAETSHPPVQHSAALSSTQAGRKQRKTEMLLVGLTGGIATGKSTVTAWFRSQNVEVIDCDQLVHDLQKPGTRCTRALDRAFPGVVKNGALDRAALGAAIFGDVSKRRKLDAVMRPFIAQALIQAIGYHFCVGTSLVILDAPLLFEFKLDKICALSIVVAAAPETQLRRVMNRDNIDDAAAQKRIDAQMLRFVLLAVGAYAVKEKATGFDFPKKNKLGALRGLGVRTKGPIKVYAVGLYEGGGGAQTTWASRRRTTRRTSARCWRWRSATTCT